MRFEVQATHPRVVIVRVYDVQQPGPVRIFLTSDLHLDSVHCRRDVFQKHIRKVKDLDALMLVFGDIVDAMQGRADPRREMSEIVEELRRPDYYDAVVEFVADALDPVRDRLVLLSEGNHETAVLRHRNTSLLQRIVGELRRRGSPVEAGAYGGWVIFRFYQPGKKHPRWTLRLYYHHGATKGAPVTKGTIEHERLAARVDGADVIVAGHNHRGYILPTIVDAVTDRGVAYGKTVWHIRTAGYKEEWLNERRGFAMEGNHGPRPLGGVMLNVNFEGTGANWQRINIVPEAWAL